MRRLLELSIIISIFALLIAPGAARAGISDCGDIDVEADAQCEVVAPGVECEAECTPVSFEAACAAQLTATCDGKCDTPIEASCDTDCKANCSADCEVDPGKFDCAASCNADCSGECKGECDSSDDKSECTASCRASCSAHCDASCDVKLPEGDCDADCEASCTGSCEAKANLSCQIDCQDESFDKCQAELKGGCKASCESEDGALFCDGQYVDHGGHLDKCVTAIEAIIKEKVKGYAHGEASCSGSSCTAEGEAGASCECNAMPGRTRDYSLLSLLGLALGVTVLWRRRAIY